MQPGNELKRLESIIAQDVCFFLQMKCSLNKELLEDFKKAIEEETERVKNKIINSVCQVNRKAELRQYIRQHQQNLIELCSHLLKHTHPEKITKPADPLEPPVLCHYSYKTLEDLLSFMENHFTGYFNPDAWVPTSYRLIAVQEVRQDMEALEQGMITAGVNNELIEIVFFAFKELLECELANDITYRKVKFLKALKAELFKVLPLRQESQDTTESVKQLLLKLNFNTNLFSTYCTNSIKDQMANIDEHPLRIEKLAFCFKEINQIRHKHGCTFDPRNDSLKEQIATWIAEELNFQQTTHQLPLSFPGTNQANTLEKIELDLSVAQIACLIYAFVKAGIFQNKHVAVIFRTIAAMVKSKKMEVISPGSLEKHYSILELNARKKVTEKLKAAIEWLSDSPRPSHR